MTMHCDFRWMIAGLTALAITAGIARSQPNETHQPTPSGEKAAPAKADDRVGDPYPFGTCPITGKKLGAMGDSVVKVYDGREVRFCCPACPGKFEKDTAASFATLDEKIIKDQTPLYPLKTSVVTGKDLPAKPFDFVYGNRLVRMGAEGEKAEFLKDPKKHLGQLDKAAIAEQSKAYPLKNCPVSNDELGEMDQPVDLVVAGRLIRLCCKGCQEDIEKDPAKFIAMIDAARKGEKPAPSADHHDHDEKTPHEKK